MGGGQRQTIALDGLGWTQVHLALHTSAFEAIEETLVNARSSGEHESAQLDDMKLGLFSHSPEPAHAMQSDGVFHVSRRPEVPDSLTGEVCWASARSHVTLH